MNMNMKYLIIAILCFPALLSAQQEINKPERATYFLAYDSIAGVYHAGITLPDQVTTSGQPSLKSDADELAFLESTAGLDVTYDTLPGVGEPVATGIYEYQGSLVICRQDHIRTIFEPSETPALFAVYRVDGDNYLEWIVGEIVYPGQVRSYNGQLYECIQQHQAVTGQTPDLVPALWRTYSDEECPVWVQPTGAQDAYPIAACVTHNGQEWISLYAANVWEPGVFGWQLR